MTLYFKKICLC